MEDWDWELLHNSRETTSDEQQQTVLENLEQEVEEKATPFSSDVDVDVDDDDNYSGVFRFDYFSIDSHHRNYLEDEEEGDSSDNPSWIDPSNCSVAGGVRERNRSSSSNSDSSGPTADSPNLLHVIHSHHSNCDYALNSSHNSGFNIEGENPISTNFNGEFSDAVDYQNKGVIVEKNDERGEVNEVLHHLDDSDGGNERVVSEEERESEVNPWSNEKKKKIVWWRVPLEVLRHCVLKVSPVWSLSMAAAAVMGLIILRRRYLYKMKRKTQGLQLKVTVDDKKVSQFKSRVARLNEAFSVVKRVPMIRPSLPAPGLAPWPVMSLR